jgi:NitT/TauT family transport system substrate-binding protein
MRHDDFHQPANIMAGIMKKSLFAFLCSICVLVSSAFAASTEIRISKQYGLPYLPLMVAEKFGLIEKHASQAGLKDIKVSWLTFGSGAMANDALLSGNVEIIAGGIGPFLRLWDKSNAKVKALAALDQSPQVLNTSRPEVKKLADFTSQDKIAMPAAKVSMQALALQMAAAKEFGEQHYEKIDHLTVSATYPDALIAITSGKSEITGHVVSEPFSTIELNHPGIHTVFSSYDILGGHHVSNLVSTSAKFYDNNRILAKAVVLALDEANQWISRHREEAAKLYLQMRNSQEPVALIHTIHENPNIVYTTVPLRITMFSDFLHRTGAVKLKADSWKDLFFDAIHDRAGS